MDIYSWQQDRKIRGLNAVINMTIGEYWSSASQIIDKNELQRKRVSTRGKTYRLLRRDLLDGCIMPPIILAITERACNEATETIRLALQGDPIDYQVQLDQLVHDAFASNELIILDGLQRTHTIRECWAEAEEKGRLEDFYAQPLRAEVYAGLSKAGILYRMMTLNTGQTPMSFRHQIEILYNDYLDSSDLPNGIKVFREKDERRARGSQKYRFSDVVDMFYAYSTGKPQSMDRQTLVSELAEMDFLEYFQAERSEDLLQLLVLYDHFVRAIESQSADWQFDEERLTEITRPFGKSIATVFERVQPMTAFGAEIKRLMKTGRVTSFLEVQETLGDLYIEGDPVDAFDSLIRVLDEIARTATKIGTSQRDYFRYSFRVLLTPDSDAYLDLSACWLIGQETYNSFYSDIAEL